MNGVSKKLCISIIGVQAIIQMSQDATDKLPYAMMIAGIVVTLQVIQVFKDWKVKP